MWCDRMVSEEVYPCPDEKDDFILRCPRCRKEVEGDTRYRERVVVDDAGHGLRVEEAYVKCEECGYDVEMGGVIGHVVDGEKSSLRLAASEPKRGVGGAFIPSPPLDNNLVSLAVVSLVTRPEVREIIRLTDGESLTVGELSERMRVPISSVYRRVEELVKANLLAVGGFVMSRGRKEAKYFCTVKGVKIMINYVRENHDLSAEFWIGDKSSK